MFKLSASERISHWKSFRQSISEMDIATACYQTLNFWKSCPFAPYYLSDQEPQSWPNPWDLLIDNCYCDLAKCLGIIYTLHLSNHSVGLNPELRVYYNSKSRHRYHIAYFCQGKYVLNLIEDEVVNKEHINQDLKLKYCYTAADLKLEQY